MKAHTHTHTTLTVQVRPTYGFDAEPLNFSHAKKSLERNEQKEDRREATEEAKKCCRSEA